MDGIKKVIQRFRSKFSVCKIAFEKCGIFEAQKKKEYTEIFMRFKSEMRKMHIFDTSLGINCKNRKTKKIYGLII